MPTKSVKLRGAAREVMTTRSAEVLLAGPAGTGKSYGALLKMHLMCMSNPGMRGLMVRKTHKSLTATGLVTFREQVAKEAIAAGICKWYGGSGEKPAQYIYSNGASIAVGGMDNPDKIMSAEYDVAFVQEATDLTQDDWEKITTRLRNGVVSFQQLIADCNPQQPTHWLKKRCDEGITKMLYSRHEDNPRLFDDAGHVTEYGMAYMSVLDNLQGVRKERLRYGRWAAAEGIIYGAWSPTLHLRDLPARTTLPLDWTRYWAVDFGYTNPFVWQMWALDPDGRLWLEKEIYKTQTLVEDHAKTILKVLVSDRERRAAEEAMAGRFGDSKNATILNAANWRYPKPRAIICDHDAEDRATLERHLGLTTIAAKKTVSDGIQAFQKRLLPAGDGQPRLYVVRDSLVERDEDLKGRSLPTCFAEEIEGYIWKPQAQAKVGTGVVPDEPNKENDHAMDAGRYMVSEIDLIGSPSIRFL